MAISGNIFKTSKAQNGSDEGSNDVVGRFRSGYQANGKPVALDSWRVTTGDQSVAEAVHELLGATDDVQEWETKTGEFLEVYGNQATVEVVFDGPGSIRTSLVLWSQKGGKIIETDGEFIIEDGKVTDKPDPDAFLTIQERKDKANAGTGPSPSLQAYFRLAAAPELGKFKFFSGSWTAMENFDEAESELVTNDGPTLGTLTLERISWMDRKTGKERSFVKPVISIVGPA